MKAPRPTRRPVAASVRRTLLDAVLLLLAAGLAWGGPRVVDALSAGEWAWYHARGGVGGLRAADAARQAGREAARALDRAAPLPLAADGVGAVLALGRELQASDPRAALAAYRPVLETASRLESSGWRALGLRGRFAELRRLERDARDRLAAGAPRP